jgi:hypothetical protein
MSLNTSWLKLSAWDSSPGSMWLFQSEVRAPFLGEDAERRVLVGRPNGSRRPGVTAGAIGTS